MRDSRDGAWSDRCMGRFWRRSSLEVLRQWRTGAWASGQGPCGAASPATSRHLDRTSQSRSGRPRHWVSSPRESACIAVRRGSVVSDARN
jgi:hypothetical protein